MEIGAAESISDIEEPKKKRGPTRVGGPGPGGRNRGGGGGNGGGDPQDGPPGSTSLFDPQKSRILTFFLLIAILMTFGGLIAAYVVIATNNVAEWKPFALPVQVWISTAIIFASSFAYHFAQTAIERNSQESAKRWLIVTTVLGASFISSQILAWIALSNRGFYLSGNPYAGFFYVLTAVHAIHVLGGITALGSVMLRSWLPTSDADSIKKRAALSWVVGWYWHFMGALWLVLFVLLGFWK